MIRLIPCTFPTKHHNFSVEPHSLCPSDRYKTFVSEYMFSRRPNIRTLPDVNRLYIVTKSRRNIYCSNGDFPMGVSLLHSWKPPLPMRISMSWTYLLIQRLKGQESSSCDFGLPVVAVERGKGAKIG